WPLFRELRESGAVYEVGSIVLLTRYADVKEVVRTDTSFVNGRSAGTRGERVRASLPPSARIVFDEVADFEALQVAGSNGEQHTRLRSIVSRAFTTGPISALRASAE